MKQLTFCLVVNVYLYSLYIVYVQKNLVKPVHSWGVHLTLVGNNLASFWRSGICYDFPISCFLSTEHDNNTANIHWVGTAHSVTRLHVWQHFSRNVSYRHIFNRPTSEQYLEWSWHSARENSHMRIIICLYLNHPNYLMVIISQMKEELCILRPFSMCQITKTW